MSGDAIVRSGLISRAGTRGHLFLSMPYKPSDRAIKVLTLALAPSAHEGEWQAAAIRFIYILRKEAVTVESLNLGAEAKTQYHYEYKPPPKPARTRVQQYMMFGKHKGKKFSEIPEDYLKWLMNQDFLKDAVRDAVEHELQKRETK